MSKMTQKELDDQWWLADSDVERAAFAFRMALKKQCEIEVAQEAADQDDQPEEPQDAD